MLRTVRGNCQASVAESVTVSCGAALLPFAALALAPGSNFKPLRQPRYTIAVAVTTTFTASGGIVSSEEACSASNAKAARLAAVGLGMACVAAAAGVRWRRRGEGLRGLRMYSSSAAQARVQQCTNTEAAEFAGCFLVC